MAVPRYVDHQSVGKYLKSVDRQAAVVAAVATADANTQTGAYVQADVQSIRTLANANKAAINAILTSLKNAGVMKTS